MVYLNYSKGGIKMRIFEVMTAIFLGFFTGVLLSEGGIKLHESGIHILLGCIFWMLIFIYLRMPFSKRTKVNKENSIG